MRVNAIESKTRNSRGENWRNVAMLRKKQDLILHNHNHDGVDRRGFLKCMAWAGTGALFVIKDGILQSYSLSDPSALKEDAAGGGLSFVQISDSRMGFNRADT